MNVRKHLAVTTAGAALVGGLALTGTAPAPAAGTVSPHGATAHLTATAAAAASHASYRLWTQRGYGYADVTKTWSAQRGSPGRYEGTVSGRVHHYHAPANRQVVVQVSTDGRVFREGATSSNRYFSVKYRYTKRVLVRACLYRSGASGVSFCGPWK
jgi:hypothetical protein